MMLRPAAEAVITFCGGAATAGAVLIPLQAENPVLRDYGPLAVVVIMIGASFKLANRIAGIVDKRLGDLNQTITKQGEQFLRQSEKLDEQSSQNAQMVSAAKETIDTVRRGVEEARADRQRLADRFDGLASRIEARWEKAEVFQAWVQAKIGELLARKPPR